MKNKLLKLVFTNLFVFAVLFASVAQVNTYPYVENFDSGIGSWVIDFNTNPMGYDVFEHGNVTDAWFPYYKANATDFYVKTDMDGTYAQETDTWVTSPVFDFTNLIQPELSLDIFADALVGWGGAFINYSIDGISWNRLGSQGDGTNWYDGSFDAYLAWGECWVNTGGGWITADIPLTFLAGESTVSFKVIFKSSTIPATLPGFGFDDFSIDEMAPGTPDPQTVELVSPQDAVCALSSTETVSVNVWNGSTADLVNTWYIQLIVDGSTYAYELISDDVLSNAMYAYTFTATHDFSAAGTYNVTVNTSFDGVNPYNTFTTTVESEGLDEINAFAHFVDFSAPTPEFGYFAGTYTTANIVGGEVVTTGVNGSFWTGGIGSTSAQNAWVDNTEYMAGGYTCNVDATGLGTLELIFDLYQQYSYSPDFCWFRVLVNGMPVADVNGVENHNPDTYEAPAFVELRYDLSAYAGTNLNIEFQSSTKNPTDIVKMDNFLLRQKLQFDLAMLALVSPGTGCGLGMEQVVVEIENIGTSPASGFDVTYILDGGSPVTETFVGAILSGFTGIHTFATAADLTGAGPFSFDVSLSWTNDLDNANDALTGITVNDISNDLTTPYTQDFSGTNNVAPYEYWAIEDANFDGEEWFWLYDHTSQEAYGFDYEGAQGIDFLYTNCFNFDASLNYKICLDYATYLSGDVKGFEVYLSTSQDMSGLVGTPIISMPNVNTSGAYQLATNVFTVPANGVYYIAFKAIGNATFEAEYLFIDNIMITQFVYPDMEVTSVLFIDGTGAPVTNDCMLGDVYVDIEFTNNSGSTLCAGETIEFSYFVSHNGNVWAPVYETHILTAPMQAGDTNPFSFTQSIDMSVQGEYIVSVIVNYSFEGNTANDQNGGNTLINYGTPQNLAIAGFTDGYCFDAPDIYINGSFTDMGYSYDLTLIASEAATSNISYNNWEYNIPEWIDGEIYFTYTVTITNDGLSCTSSIVDTILISNPTVDLGPDIVTTDYLSVLLDAGADPDGTPDFTYVWAPNGETAQQAVPTYYGTYSVSVTEGYCTVTDEITVFQEQEIDLRQGWGLWSTLIDANTITTSIDLEDVATNGGLTDVIIMKDELGLTWWPAGTPPFDQNFIGDIVNGEGYQYKMGTAETLSVIGLPLDPAVSPIPLTVGYNIIAYLRQDASPVVSELAGIVSNVSLFKDEDGLVYWPYFNIDLIGDLKPGKGYKIKVDVPVSLTYSANGPGNTTKTAINRMMPQNYADIAKTNNNMTLGIPMYAWNEIPTVGDEIGVFTAEGQLIGSTVFEGNNIAIALFGDDDLTEQKEGLQVDEVFTIKVWNQLNNTENVCKVVSWETGSDNYSVDGISVIKNIIVTNGNIDGQTALYQNIPNPFSTSTKIGFYIPEESNVNITIYNVLGESVMEVVSGSLQAGYHNYEISANELASGSYFYKFVTKDYTETKHMNIEK